MRIATGPLLVCLVFTTLVRSFGQAPFDPPPPPAPTAAERAKLDEHGFVITDTALKEGFSAYIRPSRPVLLTSDALLMTFGRLLEQLIAERQIAGASIHQRFCAELWKRLPPEPLAAGPTHTAGWRAARLFVATAFTLLNGEYPADIGELKGEVETEVQRVIDCSGESPPPWLLSASGSRPYIPYTGFQLPEVAPPYGAGFHRYRKWLQEMPLVPTDELHITLIANLAKAQAGASENVTLSASALRPFGSPINGLFTKFRTNTYPPADWDEGIAEWPTNLRKATSHRQIWNYLPTTRPAELGQLSAVSDDDKTSQFPLVVGAMLGNQFAHDLLPESLKPIAARPEWKESFGFYLTELNLPADPRAPDVFHTKSWQRKQLNTTLSAWAEWRQATQLGLKEHTLYIGIEGHRPGFVEPVPRFYHALGEAAQSLASIRHGDLLEIARSRDTRLLLELDRAAKAVREVKMSDQNGQLEENEALNIAFATMKLIDDLLPKSPQEIAASVKYLEADAAAFRQPDSELVLESDKKFEETQHRFWIENSSKRWSDSELFGPRGREALASRIETFCRDYRNGNAECIAAAQRLTRERRDQLTPNLWELATLCFQLEAIAERQLAGVSEASDGTFLKHIGQQLARLMFYNGNSYLNPQDTAPRIVRYFTIGTPGSTKIYHAATARPRLMLIRYPDENGDPVLCQGAVYAYRDVVRKETPNKKQWTAQASGSKWPEWMEEVVE